MITLATFPDGKDFAVTFVDDTDRSTRANVEPVYTFLAQRGVRGTKTVWPLRARRGSSYRLESTASAPDTAAGSTLEDPEYRDFVLSLPAMGFEIALHSVAAGNSRREEILEGLDRYRTVFGQDPAICAFHQTNIDNLYCGVDKLDSCVLRRAERMVHRSEYQGHVDGSPHFWGDIVRSVFKYVRLPFHTIAEVNTLGLNPAMPFHDARRPYVSAWFASSDGAQVNRFNRLLSSSNIAKLERAHGACIVYTHFAAGFARGYDGRYELDPGFVETVERLCRNPKAWLPTASELLDRLDVMRRVSVCHDGFEVKIHNPAPLGIEGLAIHGADGLDLRGTGALIRRDVNRWVLPCLAPGQTVTLRASHFAHYTVRGGPSAEIERAERLRIEYWNYLGLLQGRLLDRREERRRSA